MNSFSKDIRSECATSNKLGKCSYCGSVIKWGEFAYNQEMCWTCWHRSILTALNKLEVTEYEMLYRCVRAYARCFNKEF